MREVIIEDEVKYKLAEQKQELLVSQGQVKMYNEKQDFIYDLFGIEMRSQESKDYWGE